MIAIIILALLCLAAASVIPRVVLFISDRHDHGRLANIASIAGSIGFLPLVVLEWAFNLGMAWLLVLLLAYSIAPRPVMNFLKGQVSEPSKRTETLPTVYSKRSPHKRSAMRVPLRRTYFG
jgi:hypothetical protein